MKLPSFKTTKIEHKDLNRQARAERTAQGLSLRACAKRMGVSYSYLSYLETAQQELDAAGRGRLQQGAAVMITEFSLLGWRRADPVPLALGESWLPIGSSTCSPMSRNSSRCSTTRNDRGRQRLGHPVLCGYEPTLHDRYGAEGF